MLNFEDLLTRKVEKMAKKQFLSIQEGLIKRINDDAAMWQRVLKHTIEKNGYDAGAFKFFDAFTFYRLSFLDIVILYNRMLIAKDDLEKKVMCKFLALNIYEFLEDIPAVFGRQFANDVSVMADEKMVAELKNLKKSLQQVKQECGPYLMEIRNVLGGHKDHDTFKQLATLEKLELPKMELIGMAIYMLYLLINKFEKNLRAAIKEKIMLKELAKRQETK